MKENEKYLREAIQLSRTHMQKGAGGPFGAIIVKDGEIIGRGWNQVISTNDPTAHAEVTAIRDACKRLNNFSLAGSTIYTSCEPCPMCLASIYWARLDKVVYANTRHDAAEIQFSDELIYQEIARGINERAIPMVQMLRDEALLVFKEWEAKVDKIRY